MEYIVIGEILKAQGIKGEVKIRSYTDDPSRFKKLKLVYLENIAYKIESVRVDGVFVYVKFASVANRDDAERLAGKLVHIDKVNAIPLNEDSFYIVDLIGCELKTESGELLGVITDVAGYGSADVITAKLNDKVVRFPFLKKIIKNIDTGKKLFTVIYERFSEVCVYED